MNKKLQYCPNCGKREFSQIDTKKFVCSNCNFTFYKNPYSSVAGIIEYDGKILLTRRNKEPGLGKLDLPGGFVDNNETLEEALIREVREELGININNLTYLCSFPNIYPYKEVEYRTLDSFFVCSADTLDVKHDEKEIADWKLTDIEDIDLEEIAFLSIREALKIYLTLKLK